MKAQLERFIRHHVNNPREEEIAQIVEIFEERIFDKDQTFKQENTITEELGFIITGSARLFIRKDSGTEITGEVLTENTFLADIFSIRTGKPTPMEIGFLEKSVVLVAPHKKVEKLLESNLAFNILIRIHITDRAMAIGQRFILFLSGTAKERYQFFIENNPHLLNKLPLRLIAAMIGITPTQLSRIRNSH